MNTQTTRKPRSDGLRSRHAILDASARLATVEGINGLSIGGLADHIGMSKSGLYAHFKSKEELQLATIDTAADLFNVEVVEPGVAAPAGLARGCGRSRTSSSRTSSAASSRADASSPPSRPRSTPVPAAYATGSSSSSRAGSGSSSRL